MIQPSIIIPEEIIEIKKWIFSNLHQCIVEQVKNFLMDGPMLIIIIIIKTFEFSINVIEQCREREKAVK
jgi:hypothetical protein